MRVAFVSAECEPFAKTGGLGDVADALARALDTIAGEPEDIPRGGANGGLEPPVDVFLPRYRAMPVPADAARQTLRVPDPLAADGRSEATLVEFEARGYRVRLVDHPAAFDRDGYYGDAHGDYPDNAWRFGLLCRTALEALRTDERPIDVLHLHDWQSMPAVLLRDAAYADDPRISRAAALVTIHNLAYQGWVARSHLRGLAFPDEIARLVPPTADGLLLLRAGIEHAELANTVSPGYAAEVLTPKFGMDMQDLLRRLGDRFFGILNGLDMAVWNPATDDALAARYSASNLAGKAACRRALLEEVGFDPDDDGAVLGMIGRLDPQKGFDLLTGATPELVASGARVIALGTGDKALVQDLRTIAERRRDRVAVIERFDRGLARRIYAGADFFLMPSRFEPCGQGQMIAMRYGTPPVVNRTGGLADTVVDLTAEPATGTGFVFDEPTVPAFLAACRRAIECHAEGGRAWADLLDRDMAIDWSWEAGPAQQYMAAYARAASLRRSRAETPAGQVPSGIVPDAQALELEAPLETPQREVPPA